MRKLLPFLILLVAISAKATTTLTISVTSLTGGTSPGNSVRIDLQNCASARVIGTGQIVGQSQTVYPVSGVVTVTLYDNTQIDCGGGKAVSYYSFNYIFQGVITSIGSYNLLPGTFLLANLTPCVGTACISPSTGGGGGGSPGAPQFSIQYFKDTTTFGGSGSSTDSTGMQMNTPILNGAYDASKFQSAPGSNNGIANAEIAAGANGTTVANPNYPMTEAGGFPLANGTLEDRRAGASIRSSINPFHGLGLNSISASGINCMFDDNATASDTDSQFCIANYNQISGIGNDAGGGVTRVSGNTTTTVMVANGITAVDENVIDCWKDGDCHAHRDTFATQGLNSDLSQEGYGDFMPHYIQEPYIFVSSVTSVTDSTHIKTNPSNTGGAYGTEMGGGWLVKQANIDSGNITADNGPSGGIVNRRFTTSTAHAVSTAWGATTTNLGVPGNFVSGNPTSVTVSKLGGTWPASGNVCISGDHTYETTFTGATDGATVTMTIMSRYEEPIGSTIVVGSCTKMFSNPDRQLNFQTAGITSEISPDIIGAPDANTYFYTLTGVATRDQNALNSQYNWSTDLTVGMLPGGSVTRDASNNVTFADDSSNTGLGYRLTGTRTITVASCANSSFNFGPATVTIATNGNPFSLLFVQPGAIAGAASTTGCTITMSNLNGFTVHKAARVLSASDPTIPKSQFPFTGYYLLGTNTAGWTVGDAVEQPNGNSIPIDAISEVAGQTPTLGGKGAIPLVDWSCHAAGFTSAGQCSGGLTPMRITNQSPFSQYIGGGGLYTPMQMATIAGVWGGYWNIGNAPANGGIYTSLGCPPEGCSTPVPYKLFSLGGTFNSSVTYTPGTGVYSVNAQKFFSPLVAANDMTAFTFRNNNGFLIGPITGLTSYNCISFINACATSIPDDANIIGDGTGADKNLYVGFLRGGSIVFRTLRTGFTYDQPCTITATTFDCSVGAGGTGAQGKFTSVTAGSFQGTGANPKITTGTASNTDVAGQLALAGGTATFTFLGTYASSPICVASDTTAASAVKASATTTVLTLTGTGTDVVNYICIGRN